MSFNRRIAMKIVAYFGFVLIQGQSCQSTYSKAFSEFWYFW